MSIIDKIKSKKELSGIPDETVMEILKKYKLKNLSKKDEKIIIKQVRDELRKLVGRFRYSKNPSELIKNPWDLLYKHRSTKERLPFYPKLKKLISNLKPKSILDLGCGLNPIAIADKKVRYYAQDIDENNLKIIKAYFKESGIKGKTIHSDIRKTQEFPEADLCLMLKLLDILKMPHYKIKDLLKNINCKTIIASFPTVTISGKPMQNKKRRWFEILLDSLNYKFKTLDSQNELFYIIKKPAGASRGRA